MCVRNISGLLLHSGCSRAAHVHGNTFRVRYRDRTDERELLLENEKKAEARLSRSFLRDVGNSLPRNHYSVLMKRGMATAQSENRITRVITILISRGMIGRDVNARPARMPVYLAGRERRFAGRAKVGDGTGSKLPVAAKPPR
ncbi:hypothetical protein ALC57_03506 [Trachymyrmex cornetzi]|uniref:Uncharacterized protein n=1 Tax=Trachymyrmex cornetzi TaxID=471704 RepID=A0A195EFZ8_9HYME|nr:hypothetical protein ALC57_03506 [Trachymyrmex cornetzi]